jgi:hypothetical protein
MNSQWAHMGSLQPQEKTGMSKSKMTSHFHTLLPLALHVWHSRTLYPPFLSMLSLHIVLVLLPAQNLLYVTHPRTIRVTWAASTRNSSRQCLHRTHPRPALRKARWKGKLLPIYQATSTVFHLEHILGSSSSSSGYASMVYIVQWYWTCS